MFTGFLMMTIGATLVIWGADVHRMPVFDEWRRGVRDIRDVLLAHGWPAASAARSPRTTVLRGMSESLPGGRTWCEMMLRRAYDRRMRAMRLHDAADYLLSARDPFAADRVVRASRNIGAGLHGQAQHPYPLCPRDDQPAAL